MAYDAFYQYYEHKGFFFDRAILTTYALSLYTKPLVILSGISGTGKTKIAQFFSVPATTALTTQSKEIPPSHEDPLPGSWMLMTVTSGILTGDGRANFAYKDLGALLTAQEIAAIQPKIDALRKAGNDDNICEPFDFVIEAPDKTEIKAKAYLQRASSPLLRIRFKSKRGEEFYDSTTYFAKNHKVNDVLKLEKSGDKRLRIVSINEKIVIQKAQEFAEEEKKQVKNSCFISVRSDWNDATSMFGYYNLVEQKYNVTPLISFILKAQENPNLPFFLILDEMNLAKVEHYFSDFLSCLESRHLDENGELQQEPIRLYAGGGWIESNDNYFDIIPTELKIPPNLFVTGTVNIDESTYMFSAKVLDRANVIELNMVDLEKYRQTPGGAPSPSDFQLKDFPKFNVLNIPSRKDHVDLDQNATAFLRSVHSILSKHQLHFGYRVINEVSAYINNAQKYCEPTPHLLDRAIDFQLVQKILPKLNGSQSKLESPIRDLLEFLTGSGESTPMESLLVVDAKTTKYPLAVEKLQRMAGTLATHGFANYIE